MGYYYLTASLPYLRFDKASLLDRNIFLQETGKWLDAKSQLQLSRVDLKDFYPVDGECKAAAVFKSFESELRKNIAAFRKEPEVLTKGWFPKELKNILTEGNPLEIEKKLLYLRWSFIESCEKEHYFDLESLIYYFLKLQILEVKSGYDKEKGRAVFNQVAQISA